MRLEHSLNPNAGQVGSGLVTRSGLSSYFASPFSLLSSSTSPLFLGSSLALARRGEYITKVAIIACSFRALLKFSKYLSRSPRAW